MIVEIKPMREGARLPFYGSDDAAGADVFAHLDAPIYLHPGETKLIPLGFAMKMSGTRSTLNRFAAFLLPRSGLGHKHGIVLGNLIGTIDEDFTGEVMASVWNRNQDGSAFGIFPGDRIAQMVIQEVVRARFQFAESIAETTRGAGGFGSTGSN